MKEGVTKAVGRGDDSTSSGAECDTTHTQQYSSRYAYVHYVLTAGDIAAQNTLRLPHGFQGPWCHRLTLIPCPFVALVSFSAAIRVPIRHTTDIVLERLLHRGML